MIWLRFEESAAFDALVNGLYECLRRFYGEQQMAFSLSLYERNIPHLTLARFKPFNARKQAFLSKNHLVRELGELTLDQAILFESFRKETGAEYYRLSAHALGKTQGGLR